MITTILLAAAAQGASLTLIPSGMSARTGGYSPIRSNFSAAAAKVAKAPADLKNPRYGIFQVGDQAFGYILDDPGALHVDANQDGDYTNDPATVWQAGASGEFTMYRGTAQVSLGGKLATLGVYRFDPNDPQRAALKETILYYFDFGYEGKVAVGSKTYPVMVTGPVSAGARVWVDRNGNGKNEGRSESMTVGKAFGLDGGSYVFQPSASGLQVARSTETVAEIPLPPDLSVGKPILTFTATDMDGKKIDFPASYKGKVVMLDFWATWCGPCIAELPNLIPAYHKYKDKGFDILGISFDRANMAEQVKAFTAEKGMPWRQVYEGKFWETDLGLKFGVNAIPFVLLVDGNTGTILATSRDLRGPALEQTLARVFANR